MGQIMKNTILLVATSFIVNNPLVIGTRSSPLIILISKESLWSAVKQLVSTDKQV
jgi:hypothetical protein